MASSPAGQTVLIVHPPGSDREALVSAAATLEASRCLQADDPAAAEALLVSESPAVLLLWAAFPPESADSLLNRAGEMPIPVIGIMPDRDGAAPVEWESLPTALDDCVAAPVDAAELGFRIRRCLEGPIPTRRDEAEEELLFHGVDEEYVTSDPRSDEIIEVNRVFLERSGGTEADWRGRELSELGLLEEPEQQAKHDKRLRIEGEVNFRCRRRYPDGTERPVVVGRRMGMRHGRLVYLTRMRSVPASDMERAGRILAADDDADARLRLLGSIIGGRRERKGLDAALRELAEAGLGLTWLWLVRTDRKGRLKVLASSAGDRGPEELADRKAHHPYRQLLSGKEIVVPRDARDAFGEDPFVRDRSVAAYFGVPIFSGAGSVAGAVIGAGCEPIADAGEVLAILRLLAGHFAARLEIIRLRVESKSRNLQDALTGLPNRLLFNDRLEHALKEAQRNGEMVALMFVDLDRFKTVNDTLGHAVGDQVLLNAAERLKAGVRKSDTVARYAADEFTVILRHINQKDDVVRVAQKLNRQLGEMLVTEAGEELQVTASIGISFFPDDGKTGEELLQHADMAMYSAKSMGRNTTQSYVEDTDDSHQQKLMLESKLRSAENNGELRIYYQPQICAESEDIVGMEALIRWEHPELGLISPGFFIPLAEETGLIVSIGEWLLRRATRETADWHERFGLPLVLGVNLSPLQLKQTNLAQIIERALNDAGLEPRFLDLEVTESLSIKSIHGLRERLEECRELGCHISIDDFGTGQASLDYLKRFPADRIKIDQSFVRNIGVDPDDEAIVKATIAMARSLNLKVIAEGVEEEGHLEFLRANGCGEMQGYLFCRPLPADSFARLLLEREALTVGSPQAEG